MNCVICNTEIINRRCKIVKYCIRCAHLRQNEHNQIAKYGELRAESDIKYCDYKRYASMIQGYLRESTTILSREYTT